MFYEAVDGNLLLLIDKLSKIPEIYNNFYMAGGTALALNFGHRKSVDIDLFSIKVFNVECYSRIIFAMGGKTIKEENNTIDAIIDGVKLTLLYYPYEVLGKFKKIKKINLASVRDIGCMKIVAISQRAEKKDFFDIYEILQKRSMMTLKNDFLEKYEGRKLNCYHILKSFFYFNDAEGSPDPIILNNTKWEDVKKYFLENETKVFKNFLC